MDYYSMTTILGILFWVAAALTAIGFLAYVYVQIIYMRWNAEDRALERLELKREEEENQNPTTPGTGTENNPTTPGTGTGTGNNQNTPGGITTPTTP